MISIGDFYEGSDLKLQISLKGMGFDQSKDYYTIDLYNDADVLHYDKNNVRPDGEGNYYLPIAYDDIHSGSLTVVITAFVEDADFPPDNLRREVLKPINIGPIKKISK